MGLLWALPLQKVGGASACGELEEGGKNLKQSDPQTSNEVVLEPIDHL